MRPTGKQTGRKIVLALAGCAVLAASASAQSGAGGAGGGGGGTGAGGGGSAGTGAGTGTSGASSSAGNTQPGASTGPTGVLGSPQTGGRNATLPNTTQPGTVPSTMQVTPGVLPPDPTAQGIRRPYQQPGTPGNVNRPTEPALGTSKSSEGATGSTDGTGSQRRTGDQMTLDQCKQDWDSSSGMTQAQWRSSCDRMKRSGQIDNR